MTRIDLAQIKARLDAHLGPESSQIYWKSMNQYFNGQISKPDLDQLADRLVPSTASAGSATTKALGITTRKLHNEFIRSIYFNALPENMPPPLASAGVHLGLGEQAQASAIVGAGSSSRLMGNNNGMNMMNGMGIVDVEALKSFIKYNMTRQDLQSFLNAPSTDAMFGPGQQQQSISSSDDRWWWSSVYDNDIMQHLQQPNQSSSVHLNLPLQSESQTITDTNEMKQRITFHAQSHGLRVHKNTGDHVSLYLCTAMETFIRNLISSMRLHTLMKPKRHKKTLQDLIFTLKMDRNTMPPSECLYKLEQLSIQQALTDSNHR